MTHAEKLQKVIERKWHLSEETLSAIEEAEKEEKRGKMKFTSDINELMKNLK